MGIVGRNSLVARLREAMAGGGLVLLSGEAGAGKTEVARAVAGDDALWGFCEPLETPRPLGPFRDIARLLPGTPELADPVAAGERMLAAGGTLVVEDAHWIDAASADALRFLGRRIGSSHAAVLVTYRDELAADHPLRAVLGDLATARGVLRADVPPLTMAEVAEIVGSTVDPAEAHELTGGNAFLVSQLTAGGVTTTVRDSVVARLHRLPREARDVVERLSVIPGRSELADDVDAAVLAGLLRVDGAVVEFRHELVRRAVEQELGPGRRRELHAEVLRRLPADADPATVAYHASAAHDLRRALAAERAAAEQAAALGSHREAAAHYRSALVHAAVLPAAGRAPLELALSREEYWTGHDQAAREAAERALELVPDGDLRLRSTALRWLGRLSPRQEDFHRLTIAAVRVAEEIGPSPSLVAAYAGLANERMIGRDLVAAVEWARRALDLATEAGETETVTTALQALGSALLLGGDPAGEQPLRRAIEIAREAGIDTEVGRAYTNLFSAAGEGKLYGVADAVVGEAVGYFVSRDLDAHGRYTRAWHARCRFEQGRWDEALAEADRALSAPMAITIAVLTARYVRGRIAVRRGEAAALDESRDVAATTGSLQRIAPFEAALAEHAWLTGMPPGDGLQRTYELAVELANPWSAGELGFWLWRHGRLDALPDLAAEPYRLQVGGDPIAAGRAWERIGCPYEAADAFAESADEDAVRTALATFTRLGAVHGRQRAARRLRELGVRTIPRGPSAAAARNADGLTAREQEILTWLRDGRTDAEIAAGLHLSVRTVGHHVSAVLRKTGVRSRRDLR